MRAALLYAGRDLRVEEIPIPVPARGEALIKVSMVGLCGSDLHRYTGERPVSFYPIILGHEFYGEVITLGEDVDSVKIGEKVVGRPFTPCGTCSLCKSGRYNLCRKRIVIGQHRQGCFAEYVSVTASTLYHINNDTKPEEAVLAEPTGIALHAIMKAGSLVGKNVVVIGAGAMGLLTLRLCKQAGARCFSCDVVPWKLDLAKRFGAVETVNSAKVDCVKEILNFTNGFGPDVVIETAGISKTLEQAVDMVCYGGRVIALGLATNKAGIPPFTIAQKELELIGGVYYVGAFECAVNMINSHMIDYSALVTHILPLADIGEGFEMLLRGNEALKILVNMRG